MSRSSNADPRAIGSFSIDASVGESVLGRIYRARRAGSVARVVVLDRDDYAWLLRTRYAESRVNLGLPGIASVRPEFEAGKPLAVSDAAPETLGELVRAKNATPQQALAHVVAAARILERAHAAGRVHGLVALDDIEIGPEGQVSVVGFGLAEVARRLAGDLYEAHVARDPEAVAPEVRTAKGSSATQATDVYGLGHVLRRAFGEPLPLVAMDAIEKATAADPGMRHGSCEELARDLEALDPEELDHRPGMTAVLSVPELDEIRRAPREAPPEAKEPDAAAPGGTIKFGAEFVADALEESSDEQPPVPATAGEVGSLDDLDADAPADEPIAPPPPPPPPRNIEVKKSGARPSIVPAPAASAPPPPPPPRTHEPAQAVEDVLRSIEALDQAGDSEEAGSITGHIAVPKGIVSDAEIDSGDILGDSFQSLEEARATRKREEPKPRKKKRPRKETDAELKALGNLDDLPALDDIGAPGFDPLAPGDSSAVPLGLGESPVQPAFDDPNNASGGFSANPFRDPFAAGPAPQDPRAFAQPGGAPPASRKPNKSTATGWASDDTLGALPPVDPFGAPTQPPAFDPFAAPTISDDPFSSAGAARPGADAFGAPDPFGAPAGNFADPFAAPAAPAGPGFDPFGSPPGGAGFDDPFSSSKPAPSFGGGDPNFGGASDPFAPPPGGGPGFGGGADPFGAPAGGAAGFGGGPDPFGGPPQGFGGGADPFGAPPQQGFGGGADPFGAPPQQGFGGGADPFGAPQQGFGGGADPFGAPPQQGFGGGADPFGAPQQGFGGGADPFGAPQQGFGGGADPFGAPPQQGFGGGADPFGAPPQQGFGGGADPFGAPPQQGFGGGADPFGAPQQQGFGGGADPFGAPQQGFGGGADPFGAPQQGFGGGADPFGAPPQQGFGGNDPFAAPGGPPAFDPFGAPPQGPAFGTDDPFGVAGTAPPPDGDPYSKTVAPDPRFGGPQEPAPGFDPFGVTTGPMTGLTAGLGGPGPGFDPFASSATNDYPPGMDAPPGGGGGLLPISGERDAFVDEQSSPFDAPEEQLDLGTPPPGAWALAIGGIDDGNRDQVAMVLARFRRCSKAEALDAVRGPSGTVLRQVSKDWAEQAAAAFAQLGLRTKLGEKKG